MSEQIRQDDLTRIETRQQLSMHWLNMALLLVFGTYLSILFFGQREVPMSDFPAFLTTARPLLSLDLPSDFKRLPGLGLIIIGVSRFTGGMPPELTAGWLLNAALYPLCLVLLYLIARPFLGQLAVLLSLIVAINPWTIGVLIQPLVEVTLWFFTLLTFFLIARRARWAYLSACVASVLRYEGIVLILVVLILDLIRTKDKRLRFRSLAIAALCSMPLLVWVILAALHGDPASPSAVPGQENGSGSGYLHQFFHSQVFVGVINVLWTITYRVLFVKDPTQITPAAMYTAWLAPLGFFMGAGYGLYKRNWSLVAILLFFIPYWLANSLKSATRERYILPIAWMFLLISLYGLRMLVVFLREGFKPPKWFRTGLLIVVCCFLTVWLSRLLPQLSDLRDDDGLSRFVPLAVILLYLAGLIVRGIFYRGRTVLSDLTVVALLGVMACHNQFTLVKFMLGEGKKDVEFKKLAAWYRDNAGPGEKLVTTLPHMVGMFLPKQADAFVATENIGGDDLEGFLEDCRRKGITYIAWDSRLGLATTNSYYRKYKLSRIEPLIHPDQLGLYEVHLEFLDYLETPSRYRFINIYRLRNPAGRREP
ncbi:MAG: hypothetical protein JW828_01550 [Sedimentisphaerales bacterium]|nr:hypothetical protein [Sedimentisphaerales bacterium]